MFGVIDIGGTKTVFAVFDSQHNQVQQKKLPTPAKYSDLLHEISLFFSKDSMKSVGISTAGNIDTSTGVSLNFGPNINWEPGDLAGDISNITGVNCQAANDANCGALGEAVYGSTKHAESVLYVTLSTGIGTGFVYQNKILKATANSEGGKILYPDANGNLTKLEDLVSGSKIVSKYNMLAKDIDSAGIWREIAETLAPGLQAMITMFDPEIVILGGSVGNQFDKFSSYLNKFFTNNPFRQLPTPEIKPSFNPELVVQLGAYELARALETGDSVWI